MKLSVIIPVYNEQDTIRQVIDMVRKAVSDREIIVVNDGSTDNTKTVLDNLSGPDLTIIHSEKNQGKGQALVRAGPRITGKVVVVQDADLEYNPTDLPALLQPIANGQCQVVFGSRFLAANTFLSRSQQWGNRLLTWLTNCLYGSCLTDMETCYKMMKTDIWKQLSLTSQRFEVEPEITAQLLKQGIRIREVPISFKGRGYAEGKKIRWQDGLKAIWVLIKYRWSQTKRETRKN